MEKFDSKEYRDNLAKELKELRADTEDKEDDERGRELAKNVLQEVSKTGSYEIAKQSHLIEKSDDLNSSEKEKGKNEIDRFDSKGYRDYLAKELKLSRVGKGYEESFPGSEEEIEVGKKVAKNMLKEVSKTYAYKRAKEIHSVDNNDNIPKRDKEKVKREMEEDKSMGGWELEDTRDGVRFIKNIEEIMTSSEKNIKSDIQRISRVLDEPNIKRCVTLWVLHSNEVHAGWLGLPKSDDELYDKLVRVWNSYYVR